MKKKYRYFYTYPLPYSHKVKFTYWKAESADDALDAAFSFYKTTEFYIEETTRKTILIVTPSALIKKVK